MRISDEHKLVFISTPKAGSHTGFHIMETYFNAKRYGNQFHQKLFPTYTRNDYTFFTFTRNPYDRAVSLWHSVFNGKKQYGDHYLRFIPDNSFSSWCRFLAVKNKPKTNHFLHITTTDQITWPKEVVPPKNKVLVFNLEHLEEQLQEHFKIPIEVPVLNNKKHQNFWDIATQEDVQNVNIWAEKDFEYGYEKQE